MMIEYLQKSSARGKWKSFLDALAKSEYSYIKSLLERDGKPGVKVERERAIIRMFIPFLEKTVQSEAKEIVDELYSRNVLNDTDVQIIRAKYQSMGNTYATIVLLERMQCRQAPDIWYYHFLDVLVKKGLEHVVKQIEPDFLQCPEVFRSCNAKHIECEEPDTFIEAGNSEMPVCSTSGDIQEHILTEMPSSVGGDEFEVVNGATGVTTESDIKHHIKEGIQNDKSLSEKLYPFQNELAENALAGKNTIICAPTGCGKTWVATHIIDRHLKSPAKGENKRKVVFMAKNGVLVKQQMDFISAELTGANIKHIEGNTEESTMMNAFLNDYDIFLFTPQILVNNLNSDIESLSVFSLLVLDECHHAKGEEPYNVLMKKYLMEKSNGIKRLPQIIGLTATIGTGRAKTEEDALGHIFQVCASLDVRCLSTVERHKEDLAKHFSVPNEEKIVMKKRPSDPCRGILLEALKKTADILDGLALMEEKLISIMHKCPKDREAKEYEKWVASVIKVAESFTGGQGRDITTCAKYLQVYYNALEINRLLRKTDVAVYLAKQLKPESENQERLTSEETRLLSDLKDVQKDLRKVESENPNVHLINKIISNHFVGKEVDVNSRVMVFVHARATCRALADFLNEELKDINVKASPLLGKDTRGTDKGMTEDEQTQILNDFKEGAFRVLVATSIGMEGLDVPDCNMTLNYNFTGNEITKIQMSGRSRKADGKEVQIGTDAQLAKDSIVMYRIKLMTEAMEKFKKLDINSINRRVLDVQRKMIDDAKLQQKIKDLKRYKQSDENDYEIKCRRCGTFVCNTSDLRQLGTSFLVALQGFQDKITKKPHTKRGNMGALQKRFKMTCNQCPMDWGVIAVKDEIEYFVLKLESLKFVSSSDQMVSTYKKWYDMPYKVKELTVQDLDDMYNDD